MANIPVEKLISLFQQMYREHWRYRPGAAECGTVDCSGAFAYAFYLLGGKIAHGSNAIARQYVDGLQPVKDAQPGMAAFKVRKPGDPGYALPEKYRKGGSAYNGDLNDYYHIGLVDEDDKHVLNAQGVNVGFTRTALKNWACVGALKGVDYGTQKGYGPMQKMIVTSDNGYPVKVRVNPNQESVRVDTLPVGTEVMAGEDYNGWRQITYGDDGAGYMMSKFLKPADIATDTDLPGDAFVRTLTTTEYNRLCEARDQIAAALDTIKSIVGVG